jgi:hypothetical protein
VDRLTLHVLLSRLVTVIREEAELERIAAAVACESMALATELLEASASATDLAEHLEHVLGRYADAVHPRGVG